MKTQTTEKIGTTLPESWFIERIGETIMAESANAFNGAMKIHDESHAKYLCVTCQKYLNYRFSEHHRTQPTQ